MEKKVLGKEVAIERVTANMKDFIKSVFEETSVEKMEQNLDTLKDDVDYLGNIIANFDLQKKEKSEIIREIVNASTTFGVLELFYSMAQVPHEELEELLKEEEKELN